MTVELYMPDRIINQYHPSYGDEELLYLKELFVKKSWLSDFEKTREFACSGVNIGTAIDLVSHPGSKYSITDPFLEKYQFSAIFQCLFIVSHLSTI